MDSMDMSLGMLWVLMMHREAWHATVHQGPKELNTTEQLNKSELIYTYTYIYAIYSFFIPSSVDGYFGCFSVLAIAKSAAMNIGVYVPVWISVFTRYMPKSGIAGSYGNYYFLKETPYSFT